MSETKHAREMTPDEFRAARARLLAESDAAMRTADAESEMRAAIIRSARKIIMADKGGS